VTRAEAGVHDRVRGRLRRRLPGRALRRGAHLLQQALARRAGVPPSAAVGRRRARRARHARHGPVREHRPRVEQRPGASRSRAVLNLPQAQWELTGTLRRNQNELLELGEGIEPIIFGLGGATQRHQPGYPLGGYWGRRLISFEDANNDGIIQHTEVQLSDGGGVPGQPESRQREFTVSGTATLFNIVRLNALFDGKSDYVLNNSTRYFRCASAFVNCREAFDPNTPLRTRRAPWRPARAGLDAREVYFEDASFVKLREVSVTLMAPQELARRMRTQGLSLTLAGRNLATWTDYTGFDPELNFARARSNFSTADFLTQPQLRYFTARVNLNF
jgi:hypothetical protein